MSSRTQAHIYHLQTSSYAAHKALQEYYEEIVELIDEYAEAYQGKYEIISGYMNLSNYREDDNFVTYFEGLRTYVERIRTALPQDDELVNILDDIATLINTTIYKLKTLK
jgi:DNA-binding ferritin-like protein